MLFVMLYAGWLWPFRTLWAPRGYLAATHERGSGLTPGGLGVLAHLPTKFALGVQPKKDTPLDGVPSQIDAPTVVRLTIHRRKSLPMCGAKAPYVR